MTDDERDTDRRAFLRRSAALFGATAAPAWLTNAFAQGIGDSDWLELDEEIMTLSSQLAVSSIPMPRPGSARRPPVPERPGLSGEIDFARAIGKPLLAFVVPKRFHGERGPRQQFLGAWLSWPKAESMVDLALCHVTCASRSELTEVVAVPATDLDAEAIFLDTSTTECRPRALRAGVRRSSFEALSSDGIVPGWKEVVRDLDRGRHTLSRALHSALLPDEEALARLAEQSMQSLAAHELERVSARLDEPESLDLPTVDRAAAFVRHSAALRPSIRRRVRCRLASAALRRLRIDAPPGARWYERDLCTHESHDEAFPPNSFGLCGAGFAPTYSRRFLRFFEPR